MVEHRRVQEAEPGSDLPTGPELTEEKQTARMTMRPLRFMEELRARFGEVFTIRLLDEPPWVMVSDPKLIKAVFKAPPDVLYGGEPKRVVAPILGDNSVLLLDGERHMEQRKLLLPLFAPNRIGEYEKAMRGAAERAIESWPRGTVAPAATWTRAIALEAILGAIFGAEDHERLRPLRDALRDLPVPGNASEARVAPFRHAIERVDSLIYKEIDARACEPGGGAQGDVLSLLLEARHEDGSPMSRTEIRDEMMTLLAADCETTATSLAWALERLAHDAEALARTAEEAAEGGGPYTDAVVRKTLRVRPAVPFVPRGVKGPFELDGRLIPPAIKHCAALLLTAAVIAGVAGCGDSGESDSASARPTVQTYDPEASKVTPKAAPRVDPGRGFLAWNDRLVLTSVADSDSPGFAQAVVAEDCHVDAVFAEAVGCRGFFMRTDAFLCRFDFGEGSDDIDVVGRWCNFGPSPR